MSSDPSSAPAASGRGRGGRTNGPAIRGRGRRHFGAQLTIDSSTPSKRPPVRRPSKSPIGDNPFSPISPIVPKGKSPIGDSSDGDDTEEQEICFICAEPFKYYALGVCSHRTCHICAIRMRALYKKLDCTFCKTALPNMIFTEDPSADYSTYDLTTFKYKDAQLSIYCETFQQLNELLNLLKFNCPHPDCSSILTNWKELKSHTNSNHGLSLCDLFCTNKKVFTHEHTLFNHKGLIVHQNQGSVGVGKGIRSTRPDEQGQSDLDGLDDGFKGHPKCEFCSTYFYDDDQLYKHCREKHEQCFICVRNESGRWQYYLDYHHLETHFRTSHHICTHSTCLQARFVVFETAFELQSHQVAEHGAEMGGRAYKDARKIETNFVYSSSREQQNQGVFHGRSDHQAQAQAMSISPVVTPSGSNLSDANRVVPGLGPGNRVINGTGNRRKEKSKFKSTLTVESTAEEPLASGLASTSTEVSNPVATPAVNGLNVQRHVALMQRVEEAVGGSDIKLASFRSAVKTYRNNEMSASGFLDVLSTILDGRSDILGGIVNNLLDLLDIGDDRKIELLKRWKDLRVDQTHFPSLDGAGPSRGPNLVANYSNINLGGPSRGFTNWSRGGDSNGSPFPLPARAKPVVTAASNPSGRDVPGLTPRLTRPGISATAWSGTGSATSSSTNTARVTKPTPPPPKPPKQQPSSKMNIKIQKPTNEANFPGLPINQALIDRQLKKKEMLEKTQGWKTVENVGSHQASSSSNNSNSGWQNVGQSNGDSDETNGQVVVQSGKKAKKVLLFTTSRPS